MLVGLVLERGDEFDESLVCDLLGAIMSARAVVFRNEGQVVFIAGCEAEVNFVADEVRVRSYEAGSCSTKLEGLSG